MADLRGARVALLEGRMGGELAQLVVRHGGTPVSAPALLEVPVDGSDAVVSLLAALTDGEVEVVIFLTGVAVTTLFAAADALGRGEELTIRLQRTVNIARGQKPSRPLKQRGVPITVTVEEPYTTADVIRSIEQVGVAKRGVALLHYGERSEELTSALVELGARPLELFLYEWRMPEDVAPLQSLIRQLIAGEVEVVAFTSKVQLRHLLIVAEESGLREEVIEALRSRTLVAAVGPTCAAALESVGIVPDVVPVHPKMGPMVVAIATRLLVGREVTDD